MRKLYNSKKRLSRRPKKHSRSKSIRKKKRSTFGKIAPDDIDFLNIPPPPPLVRERAINPQNLMREQEERDRDRDIQRALNLIRNLTGLSPRRRRRSNVNQRR